MEKELSKEEFKKMIEGKEPEIKMEFYFIEEEKTTIAVVHIKEDFKQNTDFIQFINEVGFEVGNAVNCAILKEKGLLPRKEDVGRA